MFIPILACAFPIVSTPCGGLMKGIMWRCGYNVLHVHRQTHDHWQNLAKLLYGLA